MMTTEEDLEETGELCVVCNKRISRVNIRRYLDWNGFVHKATSLEQPVACGRIHLNGAYGQNYEVRADTVYDYNFINVRWERLNHWYKAL